jgi:hypothetical protein
VALRRQTARRLTGTRRRALPTEEAGAEEGESRPVGVGPEAPTARVPRAEVVLTT